MRFNPQRLHRRQCESDRWRCRQPASAGAAERSSAPERGGQGLPALAEAGRLRRESVIEEAL
jgi:hypothetical protein